MRLSRVAVAGLVCLALFGVAGAAEKGSQTLPDTCAASTRIVVDAGSARIRQAPATVDAAKDICLVIERPGPMDNRYRVEVKSEDEAEPRRYEAGGLSGTPIPKLVPEEFVVLGAAGPERIPLPGCSALLARARALDQSALADLAIPCKRMSEVKGRIDSMRRAVDAFADDAGTLAKDLRERVTKTDKVDESSVLEWSATYRFLLAKARGLKAAGPATDARPKDLAAAIRKAWGESKPLQGDKAAKNAVKDILDEAVIVEEAWSGIDTRHATGMQALQTAFTDLRELRSRVAGASILIALGRFPGGKRVTVTLHQTSIFELESPGEPSKSVTPQAEHVLLIVSFHVMRRIALAVTAGVGVASVLGANPIREYALTSAPDGSRVVGLKGKEYYPNGFFVLVSANLRPDVEPQLITGPWLSAGFSVTDPLSSWVPLGVSVEYADTLMITLGLYWGHTKELLNGFADGTAVTDKVTDIPVRSRSIHGVMLLATFDLPVFKLITSKP